MAIQNSLSTHYPISGLEQMLLIAIPIIAVLGLLLTLGVSIYHSARKYQGFRKNATVPILRVSASIASKRTADSPNGSKQYFATFSLQDGQVFALLLPQDEYQHLEEGDVGELSYQGTQFIQFLLSTDHEQGRREVSP